MDITKEYMNLAAYDMLDSENRKVYILRSFTISTFFAFNVTLVTNNEIIKFIVSGNTADDTNVYTEYAVLPKTKIKIYLKKVPAFDKKETYLLCMKFEDETYDVDNMFIKIENMYDEDMYFKSRLFEKPEIPTNPVFRRREGGITISRINGTADDFPFLSFKKTCQKISYRISGDQSGFDHFLYIDRVQNSIGQKLNIINDLENVEHDITFCTSSSNFKIFNISFDDIAENETDFINDYISLAKLKINVFNGGRDINFKDDAYSEGVRYRMISIKKQCTKISTNFYKLDNLEVIYFYIDGVLNKKITKKDNTNNILTEYIAEVSDEEHEFTWITYNGNKNYNYRIEFEVKFYNNGWGKETDTSKYYNKMNYKLENYYNISIDEPLENSVSFYNPTSSIKSISIKKTCSSLSFYRVGYTTVPLVLNIDGKFYKLFYAKSEWDKVEIDGLEYKEHEFEWILFSTGDYTGDAAEYYQYSCIDGISFDCVYETDITKFDNLCSFRMINKIHIQNNSSNRICMDNKNLFDERGYNNIGVLFLKGKFPGLHLKPWPYTHCYIYLDGVLKNTTQLYEITIIDDDDVETHELMILYYVDRHERRAFDYECIFHLDFNGQTNFFEGSENIDIKTFDINKNGYFGSDTDNNNIKIDNDTNNKFLFIDVNVDIGETKSIINDINITPSEYVDKEIIPFEDETYKGPQFLYPIFYNLGIPFNKFVKFNSNIIVNGIEYDVSHVRISNPIDEENKFGVVQFLLSDNTKLLSDVSNSYSKHSVDIKEKLFGITFYPIILNENGDYEYRIIDSIPNSIVTQNSNANVLINSHIIENECIDKIDVKENKCVIVSEFNDVYLFDLISLKPISTKFINPEIYGKINSVAFANDPSYIIIENTNSDSYILNTETLDFDDQIDASTLHSNRKLVEVNDNYIINNFTSNEKSIRLYKERYQLEDNENEINEIKFTDDENYITFIKNSSTGKYRVSLYRDNLLNNGISGKTFNVEIVPSIVESINGVLMCPEDSIREGFPKSFEIR